MLKVGVALEVRTTVHPLLTPPEMLARLARELAHAGVVRWVLQAFRTTGCANEALLATAPQGARIDDETVAMLRAHVPEIEVR
jgi:pyruvate formate lyase activating enzyme